MRVAKAVALAILLCAGAADAAGAHRYVEGTTVVSDKDPRVRLQLPHSMSYVGSNRWVLFGIADCQQYAFVRADARKRVRALYWVQFESYLPSLPKLHHTYASKRHATLDGMEFYVETWTETSADRARPPDLTALKTFLVGRGYRVPPGINSGSDEQHIDALLNAKGYALPSRTMSVRLVHLVDAQQRKELMVIYTEDGSAVTPGGWKATERALIERGERLTFY